MKSIFTFLAFMLVYSFAVQAQAPDFTVTDLDGVEHNLYDILDDGKVVVLDCSATWCPPCWGFHEEHFLKDIHDKYGPDGTDQVRVIFYEADAATGQADLEGTTSGTMGDWLTGVTYPIINETPITLSGAIFWPLGFPTINVISPNDKKIIADLYDPWQAGGGVEAMFDIIESAFPVVDVKTTEALNVSVFPNPTTDELNINLTEITESVSSIEIINITGQTVYNNKVTNTKSVISINMQDFAKGSYIVNLRNGDEIIGTKQIIKN